MSYKPSSPEEQAFMQDFMSNMPAIQQFQAKYPKESLEGAYQKVTGKPWMGGRSVKMHNGQPEMTKDRTVKSVLGKYVAPAALGAASIFAGPEIMALLGSGGGAGAAGGTTAAASGAAASSIPTIAGLGELAAPAASAGPAAITGATVGGGSLIPGISAASHVIPKAAEAAGGSGGLKSLTGKVFGKGGIDPTTALLGGLSMLQQPNQPRSFAGTAVDPVKTMTDTLAKIDALSAKVASRGPSRLKSPLDGLNTPAPVTIPGLPFQIGGGLGNDPSQPPIPEPDIKRKQ